MPPPTADTSEATGAIQPFCAEASRVVVSFDLPNRESDHDPNCNCHHGSTIEPRTIRQTIRVGFRVTYTPPMVTFRFNANVFSYNDGKKISTIIYVDIPPHHISSLEQTPHVDPSTAPELSPDDRQHFMSGVTRVHVRLRQPGLLIEPSQELSLKPSSQRTLASLARLATSRDLVLFFPHTTLSKSQCETLQRAATAIAWRHDKRQQQATEHRNWLSTLYSGNGGRVHDVQYNIDTPTPSSTPDGGAGVAASDSGESTVATSTPPAYSRRVASHEHDDASGHSDASNVDAACPLEPTITKIINSGEESSPSPPAYNLKGSNDGQPTLTNDPKGKQVMKRPRSRDDIDARYCRRRLDTAELSNDQQYSKSLAESPYFITQHKADAFTQLPASLILSKLDQVLDQNASLKSELAIMRDTQQVLNDKLRDMIDMNYQHVQRIEELEAEIFELGERQDELESEQAHLAERQEVAEEQCVGLEIQVADQVQEAVRDRLLSALETM